MIYRKSSGSEGRTRIPWKSRWSLPKFCLVGCELILSSIRHNVKSFQFAPAGAAVYTTGSQSPTPMHLASQIHNSGLCPDFCLVVGAAWDVMLLGRPAQR